MLLLSILMVFAPRRLSSMNSALAGSNVHVSTARRPAALRAAQTPSVFNAVTVTAEAAPTSLPERTGSPLPERSGVIEIQFAGGGQMPIFGSVAASTVSALMKADQEPAARSVRPILGTPVSAPASHLSSGYNAVCQMFIRRPGPRK